MRLPTWGTDGWCAALPEEIFLHDVAYYRVNSSERIEDCGSSSGSRLARWWREKGKTRFWKRIFGALPAHPMRRTTRGPSAPCRSGVRKQALQGRICFWVSVLRSLESTEAGLCAALGSLRRCLGGGVDRWKSGFPGGACGTGRSWIGAGLSMRLQGSSDLCEDVFGVWPGRDRRKGRLRLLPECDGRLGSGWKGERNRRLRSAFFS